MFHQQSSSEGLAVAVFLIVAGIFVFIFFWYQKNFKNRRASWEALPVKKFIPAVSRRHREILQKYFSYYQKLSPENKIAFERRVARFIKSKRFIPRQVNEVTLEAKVLIAASAIQLTFGLPKIYLGHFDKILVYPNDYYSSITKRYHKGEVNPRFGIIVLSWQSFIDGYIKTNDSKNLGLHEMAHALRLEQMIRSDEYPPFEEDLFQQFDNYADRVCHDPEFFGQTFFRPYACTDPHEFFSVAVENFFERASQFRDVLPELYSIMTKLLGQDPLQLTESQTF